MSTQQHVLTLELQDDPELISLYDSYHQPGAVWPEVLESIQNSGIESMQIFRLGTLLVILLEVNANFSFTAKYEADKNNPKVQEWERLMERFQRVDIADPEQGKWRPMLQIFSLTEH
jgi:L-rhamnose mutarotase